jgi:urease accessory protein
MIELIEKLQTEGGADDTLTLPYDLRQKSRQRVSLDSGREAAIVLSGATSLASGDRLRASDGTCVRIISAPEPVSTVVSDDFLDLTRASYHLGNRHVSLQVGSGWLRYQPDHVLDDMVRSLGLSVVRESAPFEPERGAYHGHGTRADHSHDSSSHAHSHSREPAVEARPGSDRSPH